MLLLVLLSACATLAYCATIPRPEYPTPQFQRSEWLNLNGTWEFAESDEPNDNVYLTDNAYPDKIVVPFCRESKLSGLGRKGFVKNVWYRRTFDLPQTWKSPRTLIHIGACDWRTRVWLNGALLGTHTGGSTPVTFEVTKQLKPGRNTVIVHAFDDTASGLQATGKQCHSLESVGCMYTRTTGIWQTVWLEGVGQTYIRDFHIEPNPANSRVLISAEVDGSDAGVHLVATAYAGAKIAGKESVNANWRSTNAVLNLKQKHLWSAGDPFLYTLDLKLVRNGKVIDSVKSYFGLRDIAIQGAAILVNGKPVFQRLVLDQGFYPDGIWTAPSDKELRADIERSQALGFNGARLHQKVFDPRYLYWADKMGYLVWGEFPNWGLAYSNPAVNLPVVNEWTEVLRRDRNHPAIIGWCPFNETGKDAAEIQDAIVQVTRFADPTRPVIDTSGFTHSVPDPDVLDAHDYDQNPQSFRQRWCDGFGPSTLLPARYGGTSYAFLPFMVSEYGGIGWNISGGWGYGAAPKNMDEFYTRYKGLTDALLDSRYMFGFCYTQLYDVEQEHNGMYTYDRKLKFNAARIRAINSRQAECERNPALKTDASREPVEWTALVGAVQDGDIAKRWKYTTDEPASHWTTANFDDSAWKTGLAAFGNKGGWDWAIHSPWKTSDIWLRQSFKYDGSVFHRAMLVAHYDNDTEVYVNGKRIWQGTGWNDRYDGFSVYETLQNAIKKGQNEIAIHCHQDSGGQYIDAALLIGR